MSTTVKIKPHHFVDIISSYGAGKRVFEPHDYGHAVHVVAERVLKGHDTKLIIEMGIDDICDPCKHNVNGACADTINRSHRPDAPPLKNDWNLLIDNRWCERLGIKQDDTFTARDLCVRIRDRMGDITDIYREIPKHMTDERAAKLKKGLAVILT